MGQITTYETKQGKNIQNEKYVLTSSYNLLIL